MNIWQKIINLCFTIIITLLIYQNNKFKEDVEYLEKRQAAYYRITEIIESCEPKGEIHEYVSFEYDPGGSISGKLKSAQIECP